MIGSPFSVLVASIFSVAILALVIFLVFGAIGLLPRSIRLKILYMCLLLAMAGTASILGAQSYVNAQLNVKKLETRKVSKDPFDYPWYAIAQIYKKNGLIQPCSATMIASNALLTSAQCLTSVSSKSGYALPSQLIVKLPDRKPETVIRYIIGPDFKSDKSNVPEHLNGDWAILYIRDPIEDRTPLALNQNFFKPQNNSGSVSLVSAGHAGKPGEDMEVYKNCHIYDHPLFNFFLEHSGESGLYHIHNCPEWGQAAGIPFLAENEQGYFEVTGMHSSLTAAYGAVIGIMTPVTQISEDNGIPPYKQSR